MEPLLGLNHWGVLNVLCVLLSKLAPVKDGMRVVMPQFKAGLYHISKEVRAAVSSVLCKPANWQPAIDLIARDGDMPDPQY